ncbi:MAG: glycosyltransferase family 4 protein [Gelidibacter sp.]|nr:glycosyltransferase family 4 protein [Gelidibacter sp.]
MQSYKILICEIKKLFKDFLAVLYFLKFYASQRKKIKNSDIIFFFPYYHTGGAERVHTNILKSIHNKKCCVIFTHKSATNNFKANFNEYAECIELNEILNKKSKIINDLLFKLIYKTINKSKTANIVFGSNTTYFYAILPYIENSKVKIDLIHALSKDDLREDDFVKTAKIIDKRIVINNKAKSDIVQIYNKNNMDFELSKRIGIIENGIEIGNKTFQKKAKNRIGYIGRWSEEKRPEVFLEIAKQIKSIYPAFEFVMAGTGMKSNIDKISEAEVQFLGEITNADELQDLYSSLKFVLITSVYEGFPMIFMESMIHGVIPISTNVGGISEHIKNNFNGILIKNADNEKQLEKQFVESIKKLIEDKNLADEISKNAFEYAQNNFSIEKFNKSYQQLLN